MSDPKKLSTEELYNGSTTLRCHGWFRGNRNFSWLGNDTRTNAWHESNQSGTGFVNNRRQQSRPTEPVQRVDRARVGTAAKAGNDCQRGWQRRQILKRRDRRLG